MQVGIGRAEHAPQEGTAANVRVGGGGRGIGIVGVAGTGIVLMMRRPPALLGRSIVDHNLLTGSGGSTTIVGPSRHATAITPTTPAAASTVPVDAANESPRRCWRPSTKPTSQLHAQATHAQATSEAAARLTQCRGQRVVQSAGGTGPVLPPPIIRGRGIVAVAAAADIGIGGIAAHARG